MRSVDFHKGLKSLPRTRFKAEVFQIWATRCPSVSWRVVTIWATLWATPERLGHSGGAEEKTSRRLGYKKDKHQSSGKSGKKRRWRPSGASRRRTTPEAGQTPASDSDAGEASQVSTSFHQKDLNQGEPVAAAATVGKTPERSERRRLCCVAGGARHG